MPVPGAMRKRARARRQLLTSPVEMAEPPSFLSPVSSCARRLDIALQRWGDSPGDPQAPGTNRTGHGARFGAAHAWPSGPAVETNTPAIGRGALVARQTPFSSTPLAGSFARPDIDTRPIRSEQGVTFAERLAANANPDAGSDASSAFGKRKAAAMLGEHPSVERDLRTRASARLSSFPETADKENAPTFSSAEASTRDARRSDAGFLASFVRDERTNDRRTDATTRGAARDSTARDGARRRDEADDSVETARVERDDAPVPFFVDPDRGVPSVRPEALASVVARETGSRGELFCERPGRASFATHVLDVRFPHEFRGGHIRGSVNVWNPVELHRTLLEMIGGGRRVANRAANASRDAFVLVCDGSGERAVRAFRHFRNLDRNDHLADYPALTIPHVFVLHGGFEAFVARLPRACTGPSVRRDEAMFARERVAVSAAARDAWRVAGTATRLSRAPDARPNTFSERSVFVNARAEQRESEAWGGDDACAMMRE